MGVFRRFATKVVAESGGDSDGRVTQVRNSAAVGPPTDGRDQRSTRPGAMARRAEKARCAPSTDSHRLWVPARMRGHPVTSLSKTTRPTIPCLLGGGGDGGPDGLRWDRSARLQERDV